MSKTYICMILALLSSALAADPVLPVVSPKGSYVVVVSDKTNKVEEWATVVNVLRTKHAASLIIYPQGKVENVVAELKKLHPRYTAFVAKPEEAGRDFVIAIHRLTRKLDDDPYTDVRWGIITGYDASDALRIAKRSEPLIINSAASSMGPGSFKKLENGFASSETDASKFWIKKEGGETEEQKVSPDPVKALVEAFNSQSPDMFVTSGHATEDNWQVIFNKNLGYFKCKDGQLYGETSTKERVDINSPGAKVYLPMGNCLIGHIPQRDCMATAWMHTGGVHQMFGYTVVTFYGYMGWGIGSYFGNQYNLSEAFFFNNQSLLWKLQKSFQMKADADLDFTKLDRSAMDKAAREKVKEYAKRPDVQAKLKALPDDKARNRHLSGIMQKFSGQMFNDAIGKQIQENKLGYEDQKKTSELFKGLWDRDTVAFYGDPAWDARHAIKDPAWKSGWKQTGENVEITITVLKDGKWGNRPLAIPFPVRVGRVRGIDCSNDLEPLVTDDFALLPVMGKERKAGDVITLKFGAFAVDSKSTSAESEPLIVKVKGAPANKKNETFDIKKLGLPESETRSLAYALHFAKENAGELVKALGSSQKSEVSDTAFLIANMPKRDLTNLNADFILENVRYAQRARNEAPWKDQITPELYQEYILPYANLSEKRQAWRKMFYDKLKPVVVDCKTPGEAAVKLNTTIYDLFNVKYHATKRPRPDQGPLESIEATYASCTGLSVLLVNACRAVGVPARIVGVAQWTKGPGNHTWVEVWDNGWHCLGASESKKLNGVWFGKGAAAADASDPLKRVYAAKFSRDTLYFPLAWNPYATYIPAVDVTDWYKKTFGPKEAEKSVAE